MTTPERLERSLPSILGDLAMGPTPDYIDDVLGTTAHQRQRPAWTFPERWLPMADITTRQAVSPRVPFRTIGVGLVVLAFIVAAALVYIGSHQTRLPAPFGPAANGLIPFVSGGDIYLGDPITGETRLLVSSPEDESGPVTSPDGTRVAFARDIPGTTSADVYVIRADGSDLHRITPKPFDNLHWGGWTPDGSRMALIHDVDGPSPGCATTICHVATLDLVDAAGSGAVKTIASADGMSFVLYRPPDGRQVLYRALVGGKWGLFSMDPDGQNVRTVVQPTVPSEMDLAFAATAYSADGNRIFFNQYTEDASFGDPGCCQLFVVNADGSDLHKFIPNTGDTWDGEAAISPDGKHIAFWHNLPNRSTHRVSVIAADGTGQIIETGPELPGTAHWVWSPDSTKILMFPDGVDTGKAYLLDPAGGRWTTVPWGSDGDLDWQRVAPPG